MRSTLDRVDEPVRELPLALRLQRLRRARRRTHMKRLTDEALWIVVGGVLAIVIATELVVAIGRA